MSDMEIMQRQSYSPAGQLRRAEVLASRRGVDFNDLRRSKRPFEHWVAHRFVDPETVREINAAWPAHDEGWYVEHAGYVKKAALMFPRALHAEAQALAAELYSPGACTYLSELVGFELLPDPWFTEGPLLPRVGGGLHEIWPGGLLKIHVDFDAHPTGLQRAANLLIYLNEDWQDEWGGELELHGNDGVVRVMPRGGTAAFFVTDGRSWHGHPRPLACPEGRTRRSLALYYYRQPVGAMKRTTTVYRKDHG
jgi:hypothetical protein